MLMTGWIFTRPLLRISVFLRPSGEHRAKDQFRTTWERKECQQLSRLDYATGLQMYNALIRTHHITSRKKVASLKSAAKKYECFALLVSGGVPGILYVQGKNYGSVQKWVDTVRRLRYKDYQLVSSVTPTANVLAAAPGTLEEVATLKELGAIMEANGLTRWWRSGMGFIND